MTLKNGENSVLDLLLGQELAAVAFVRDYIQLQFDGKMLNLYVWPTLKTNTVQHDINTAGYRDALCNQIGIKVMGSHEDSQKISLSFENQVVLEISLREADRNSVEAAMFQDGIGQRWRVWP